MFLLFLGERGETKTSRSPNCVLLSPGDFAAFDSLPSVQYSHPKDSRSKRQKQPTGDKIGLSTYSTKAEGEGNEPAYRENSSHPQQENNGKITQNREPKSSSPQSSILSLLMQFVAAHGNESCDRP